MTKDKPKKKKLTKQEKALRDLKHKEMIDMINATVKFRIAPSDIHGVGVFAICDIKKGERVYIDAMPEMMDLPFSKFKELKPEIKELILERFPLVRNGSQFLVHETLMQMYLNHSDKPNYDNKTGKTLRKIKAGEEITEDYRKIEGWEKIPQWKFLNK